MSPPTPVTRLPDLLVDQIAAGEVIERPAAVVKELVENALDAGAGRISVSLVRGGIDRISVGDDGSGMGKEDLALAVQRHCTSKLAARDLDRITTLGFRGEALPSIGAAARLAITSRRRGPGGQGKPGAHDKPGAHGNPDTRVGDGDTAWRVRVAGGAVEGPVPCGGPVGTAAVVEDLFFATPARRKFLKSARVEGDHALASLRRLALAAHAVAFRVETDDAVALDLAAGDRAGRVAAILGADLAALRAVGHRRDGFGLEGFALGPEVSRATASGQFLVVNGRPVVDPLLRTAVRVAYAHAIERGRHPVCALFLDLPPDALDVNVHPAKTELRFRDPDAVRALVIGGLGRALGTGRVGGLAATPRAVAFRPPPDMRSGLLPPPDMRSGLRPPPEPGSAGFAEPALGFEGSAPSARDFGPATAPRDDHPLGAPVAQVLDTYVIAVAADGSLVLVDQHAAHERLTHERLLAEHGAGGVARQALLLPAVVELPQAAARVVVDHASALDAAGLSVEAFGPGAVLVRALPVSLGTADPVPLVRDIADELLSTGVSTALADRVHAVLARMACHGSIRAGRRLGADEMSGLLRAIEREPRAATCPHGRPTVIRLSRDAIERMFGRI